MMDAWKDTNRMYRMVKLMEFTSQQPAPTNYFFGLIADEESHVSGFGRAWILAFSRHSSLQELTRMTTLIQSGWAVN